MNTLPNPVPDDEDEVEDLKVYDDKENDEVVQGKKVIIEDDVEVVMEPQVEKLSDEKPINYKKLYKSTYTSFL